MYRQILIMTALAAALVGSSVRADEVVLTDGSKIVGTLQQVAGGKVVIKTDFAGELTIDQAKVKTYKTDKPMSVELKGGERAVGPMDATAQGSETVAGQSGARTIDVAQVTQVWSPDKDAPDVAAMKAKMAGQKWTFHAEAGIDGQTGNSEIFSANFRFEAKYKTDADQWRLYFLDRYSKQNGKASAQQEVGGVDLEHTINDAWFAFGNVEFENNRFVNLQFRAMAVGGVGVYIVKRADLEFKTRVGLGFEHDTYLGTTPDKDTAVAQAGEFLTWKPDGASFTFAHSVLYYPTFQSLSDYRIVMENGIVVPISKDHAWNLHVGVRNEYTAEPQPGFKKLDTFYFLNFGLDF